MGWTFFENNASKTTRQIMREEWECDNDMAKYSVIEDMATSNSYFAIICRTDKKTDKEENFVFVAMIRRTSSEFGYKDMTESMGPNICNVNQKFLDKVNATVIPQNVYAKNWREDCQKHIDKIKSLRVILPAGTKVSNGDKEYTLLYCQRVRFHGSRKSCDAYKTETGEWIRKSRIKNYEVEIAGRKYG